jgi:hypothetical protein
METTGGAAPTPPQVAGYRVEELVGYGGCGEVWRARDVATGRVVALKALRHDGPPTERDRLRREAAVLAGLSSPHIVRLLTVVTTAQGLVLVLDYQGGGSLAALLRTRPRLAPGEVVTIAAPLATALAEVHGAGVVHGDISPANLLFAVDGRPVLSDLGVSRLAGRAGAEAVTAAYADPGVLDGAPLTPASDVYALGAVCFEALSGRPPYPGDDPESVLASADVARPSLLALAPNTPAALARAIESALALDAAVRLDASAFAAALIESCQPLPVRLAGATVPVASVATANVRRLPPPPVTAEEVPSRWNRLRRRLPRVRLSPRRLVAAAAAPVAVAAAIWGGVAWARSSSAEGSQPTAFPVSVTPTEHFPPHAVQSASAAPGTPAPVGSPARATSDSAVAASAVVGSAAEGSLAASPAVDSAAVPPATPSRSVAAVPAGSELLQVVAALDARRDQAFVTGDAAALARVYAPGSAPLIADRQRLSAMLRAGERARGLALKVRAVRLVRRTGSAATVQVSDQLGPYSLVSPAGELLHSLPPRGPATWDMRLVRDPTTPDGWLIAAITRA